MTSCGVAGRAKPPRIPTGLPPSEPGWYTSRYVRFAAIGVVALAAAAGIALALHHGGASPRGDGPGARNTLGPIVLNAAELKARVTALNQEAYWIGPVAGYSYELTRTATKAVYVRYVPAGVKAGANEGQYLVIATYPFAGALAAVKAVDNGHPLKVAGSKGAIAAVESGKPTNVRVAFPNVDYQIEVYAPSPQGALAAATSAALKPVP